MGRRKIELRENDGFYFLDYHCINGVRHQERKISKQKKIAGDWRNMRLTEYANNTCKICEARQKRSLLFKDIASDYLNFQVLKKKKSLRSEESIVNNLVRYFGKKGISEITSNNIQSYKKERLEIRAKDTVNRELATLRQIINYVINELGIKELENPVSKIKFEKATERENYLTEQEILRLEDIAYKRDQVKGLAIILAIRTGLRRANLLGLKWNQIDLTSDPVSIKIPGDKTKNENDIYTYITDPDIIAKIRALPSRMRHEYLFTDENGRPYQSLLDFLKNRLKEAAILPSDLPRLKDFNWHSLRHTFASTLTMKGVDLNTVREAGGWKDMKMVLRYAHLSPEHIQKALKTFDFSDNRVSNLCQKDIKQKEAIAESL